MSLLKALFGDENTKAFRRAEKVVPMVSDLEPEIRKMTDDDLRNKTDEFKKKLNEGQTLDDILPEAFAVVREVSRRTTGMRPFDVQVLGGIVIHNGDIAEMRTGEGKTLVATMPLYLNALEGKGAHLVTVNDYLAKLHAALMGQIYAFLGLSVGVIAGGESYLYSPVEQGGDIDKERDEHGTYKLEQRLLKPCTRKEAYLADITYGTNSEFGFDYLRDNLAQSKDGVVQRDLHFAVIDEIDSILIDEARTPLIISVPSSESADLYIKFAKIVRHFKEGEDYIVDEKMRAIQIKDGGIEKAEKELGIDNLYSEGGIKYVHHLETAVKAKALYKRDREYVVHNGQIVIIDEFTGRMQPGRRWSEGLHQAIEAKEGVEIQKESKTYASITYQNYFRMYKKLSGMTGTAVTSSEEFYKVYGLNTVEIPTNVPSKRIDHNDLIYQTQKGKFKAISTKVREIHKTGQPVLIGTTSVETNELLSAYLEKEGIKHDVLNAKNHEREGEIIAKAGMKGAVTIATNMAGRGVDIKLGGPDASKEEYEEVKNLGGLFVLGTERHESRRIDNQLRGRAGRQGDPGETQFFVSLEDPLMRIFASDIIKSMMGKFGIPEDEPIQQKLITRALENAQTKVEGFYFDSRKRILAYDDVLDKQRRVVYGLRREILFGDKQELDSELNRIAEIRSRAISSSNLIEIANKKQAEMGEEAYYNSLRRILLQSIDKLWVEHLELMDYTRQSVDLRVYGQRDPLIEYKQEASKLFNEMQFAYAHMVAELLENLNEIDTYAVPETPIAKHESKVPFGDKYGVTKYDDNKITGGRKIGRNERVKITNGSKVLELKFKKAEAMISSGEWRLL